ncbi:LysE family transporter [Sporolactobacillus pectinivorans]|uniref:LysE family transporter n=1 Tax=Sporolactobacillus pectinivorans TaxID=1591408 RepID=UPI000C25C0DA|nr:LysE family transporter [Sporolactobacillus pectinivorans]
MNYSAFLTYVIILTFTPGPNNLMSMEEGKRVGFRKSLQFVSGIFVSFLMLAIVTLIFTDSLKDYVPAIEPWFKVLGSAYLLYLVWKMFGSSNAMDRENDLHRIAFFSGMILNFSNIKTMLFLLTGYSSYILTAYQSFNIAIMFGLLMCIVGLCSLLLWASLGSLFNRFFHRHEKVVNTVLAILLVYSAIEIWL